MTSRVPFSSASLKYNANCTSRETHIPRRQGWAGKLTHHAHRAAALAKGTAARQFCSVRLHPRSYFIPVPITQRGKMFQRPLPKGAGGGRPLKQPLRPRVPETNQENQTAAQANSLLLPFISSVESRAWSGWEIESFLGCSFRFPGRCRRSRDRPGLGNRVRISARPRILTGGVDLVEPPEISRLP